MSSTECQEPSSCPQIKNGKTTQKYIPKFLATQIHQYGQTKSIYRFFWHVGAKYCLY